MSERVEKYEVNEEEGPGVLVEKMEVGPGKFFMRLSGETIKLFYAMLIQLFNQCGGENFLTVTIEDNNNPVPEKYAITIQKCSGTDTPAEKLVRLEKEIERLKAELASRGDGQ